MAKDIKLNWDSDLLQGDLLFSNNDLEMDEGLTTAVIVSLFSDRRAEENDILPDEDSTKRGWWGDLTTLYEDDKIGSRRWLLERIKTTNQNMQKLKQYDLEALQWMIDDEVAAKVSIEVERQGDFTNPRLAELIQIYKNDGNILSLKFDDAWNAQFELA